jgi:hypothetical protein
MVAVSEEPISSMLDLHAQISIAFVVNRVFDVSLVDGGLGGVSLSEASVASPKCSGISASHCRTDRLASARCSSAPPSNGRGIVAAGP